MLTAYSRLHRRNLVAFPVREMVFARGKRRTSPDSIDTYRKAPCVGRLFDLGMFLTYSVGFHSQSPPEWGGIVFAARLRVVRSSFRKHSTGTYAPRPYRRYRDDTCPLEAANSPGIDIISRLKRREKTDQNSDTDVTA